MCAISSLTSTFAISSPDEFLSYILFGKYLIRECLAQQLVSRYVSDGSLCHNENAEVVRNK